MADSMTESRGIGGLAVRGSKSLGPRLTTLIKDVNRELNEAEQPFRLGFTHHGDQRSDPMRREGDEQRDFLPHRAENEHRQDEAARSHSEHNSDSALVPPPPRPLARPEAIDGSGSGPAPSSLIARDAPSIMSARLNNAQGRCGLTRQAGRLEI